MKNVKDIGTRLALAGIGTAVALVFITLSYFVKNMSLSFTVLASCGIMLPLFRNYYREGLLSAVVASVIGFFIANVNVLPFVLASSFYVVFTVFWNNKQLNKMLGYAIKFAYSLLTFFILYKVVSLITVDFSKLTFFEGMPAYGVYLLLNVIFSALFLLYDILLVRVFIELKKLFDKNIKAHGN